jgi:hypothetical protein
MEKRQFLVPRFHLGQYTKETVTFSKSPQNLINFLTFKRNDYFIFHRNIAFSFNDLDDVHGYIYVLPSGH